MTPQELADIRAEIERAIAAGEMVKRDVKPDNVVPLRPRQPTRRINRQELVRQYWRWAAMACPGGVPPGFREEERPR